MAITQIARTTETFSNPITAATTVAGSTGFSPNTAAGIILRCTATTGDAAIVVKFNVSSGPGATSYELRNSSNTAVSITVQTGGAYELPGELFAAPFVTITTASGTATFIVSLKS
jgi:hypothetical protein